MNRTENPGAKLCPRCGKAFTCGMQAGAERCWCADLPPLGALDPAQKGCYCPDCLKALIAEREARA